MLFLQLPLLVVLLPGGDNKDDFQEPVSFQIIRIYSFYNHSWVQTLGSGWLGELQTHGLESNSGSYIFLWPWSKGNFSNEEWKEQEKLCFTSSIQLIQAFQNHASQWQLDYPFELQTAAGCELHFGGASVGFMHIAYQRSDFMSFQNNSWLPSPKGGSRAQHVCSLFNLNQVGLERADRLVSDICPRLLLGLLDAGKADLQRQVKPEAWLSTGPSPGPGHLMLVCHVSGFHPKPIWVMWMRGEQEYMGTQRSDILPNADGTWYLWKSLDVEATEAAGLSCRVRHSSLGGQDIILYWSKKEPVPEPGMGVGGPQAEQEGQMENLGSRDFRPKRIKRHHNSMVLIFLAVIVPLVLLTGLAFSLWKRWTPCKPPSTLLPLE